MLHLYYGCCNLVKNRYIKSMKNKTNFVCQSCGSAHSKWSGKCTACGEWNTLVEESVSAPPKGLSKKGGKSLKIETLEGSAQNHPRLVTDISEFDRVCGGGLVPGSATLIGGDPGIGKSTLLLQAAAKLSTSYPTLYVSGEEAVDQIRLRAKRLNVTAAPIQLAAAINVRDIIATFDTLKSPAVAIIDSIQTMYVDTFDSAPGTVGQVRASTSELIRAAKTKNIALLIVGHVTKEGAIAGPKVLEHMVDTVLYFEGDRGHQFRILRTVKNRFGATDEIGVFEMQREGLMEVKNPSALFLSERGEDVSGSVVLAGMEGTRPMLVEIQALLAPSPMPTPRRTVVGWDNNRLAMIMAVLEARCGIPLSQSEIYLNIAGGLKITEPAADLAVAAALLSSKYNTVIPSDTILFGEVSLAGEVRPVSQADLRLKEAAKLGFKRAIIPAGGKKSYKSSDLKVAPIQHLKDLLPLLQTQNTPSKAKIA